jgi:hypothetical protein
MAGPFVALLALVGVIAIIVWLGAEVIVDDQTQFKAF